MYSHVLSQPVDLKRMVKQMTLSITYCYELLRCFTQSIADILVVMMIRQKRISLYSRYELQLKSFVPTAKELVTCYFWYTYNNTNIQYLKVFSADMTLSVSRWFKGCQERTWSWIIHITLQVNFLLFLQGFVSRFLQELSVTGHIREDYIHEM